MQMITIKGREHYYEDSEIISFGEGLIGLPDVKRAVLISMNEFEPFSWLASVDDEKYRFVVVDPKGIFEGYEAAPSRTMESQKTHTLAIVKVSSDWQKTTVNLRAPIIVNTETQSGEQIILSGSNYCLEEAFPLT